MNIQRPKWKRFLFIWIVLPALSSLFTVAAGAYVGASKPNEWYTVFVLWIASNISSLS